MEQPWIGDIAGSTLTIQRWVLATFSGEKDENGKLKSVMGCKFEIGLFASLAKTKSMTLQLVFTDTT